MVRAEMPKTIEEALEILSRERHTIFAGGTDLMVQRRTWAGLPRRFDLPVLFVKQIEELGEITTDDRYLKIGAAATLEAILEHRATPGLIKQIILEMASPAIRHQGTLAGNIANASPAGDSLVGLYLYDAEVVLSSLTKQRIIKVCDFIEGVRKIDLKDDEMITEIRIPNLSFDYEKYVKVGPRKSDAISKVAFGGAITFDKDRVSDIRIAFGAVFKTVLRSPAIEAGIKGMTKKDLKRDVSRLAESYVSLLAPIDDQRSTKHYRLQVALNLLKSFIEDIR